MRNAILVEPKIVEMGHGYYDEFDEIDFFDPFPTRIQAQDGGDYGSCAVLRGGDHKQLGTKMIDLWGLRASLAMSPDEVNHYSRMSRDRLRCMSENSRLNAAVLLLEAESLRSARDDVYLQERKEGAIRYEDAALEFEKELVALTPEASLRLHAEWWRARRELVGRTAPTPVELEYTAFKQ